MRIQLASIIFLCSLCYGSTDYYHHAQELLKQGKHHEAINSLHRAISLNPLHVHALFSLANEYFYQHMRDAAFQYYQRVLRINPEYTPAYFNCGYILFEQQDYLTAQDYFSHTLACNPHHARAAYYRGKCAQKLEHNNQAESDYRLALSLSPDYVDVLHELAMLLRAQERIDEALALFEHITHINTDDLAAKNTVAYTANMIGKTDIAVQNYRAIIEQHPHDILALYNMGYSLKMAGMIDEAIFFYDQVLQLQPNYDAAEYAKALSYLMKGDFVQGWQWYELYLKRQHINADKLRTYIANGNVEGKRILLIQQGGLGDTLQFIRFAKPLHDAGAYIMACVPTSLHSLLKLCPYIDELLKVGAAYPDFDDRATIMGLPAIMNAQEQDMLKQVPYLYADDHLVAYWKEQIKNDGNYKIGICWQADVKNDANRPPVGRRGIPLALLAQLSGIPGISFYSLQACDGLEQLNNVPYGFIVHTFDGDFDNSHGRFMDTAAVIKNMNLIITVDTAIAHLAGGLDVPVWLLLPYHTDWRWIVNRTDSPWYPSMQIFKQTTPFDWHEVITRVKEQLIPLIR